MKQLIEGPDVALMQKVSSLLPEASEQAQGRCCELLTKTAERFRQVILDTDPSDSAQASYAMGFLIALATEAQDVELMDATAQTSKSSLALPDNPDSESQ